MRVQGIGYLLSNLVLLGCAVSQPAFMQLGEVQLSPPQIAAQHVFFEEATNLYFGELPEGVLLCVSGKEDGREGEKPIYENKMTISESSTLRFRAKGRGFISSEYVTQELFKVVQRKVELGFLSPRAEPYNKADPEVLFDLQKAKKNFSDRGWLGFKQDTVHVELKLQDEEIKGVTLSFLEDQRSWIFGPKSMRVDGFGESNNLLFSKTVTLDSVSQSEGEHFRFLESTFSSVSPHKLRISIFPLQKIPSWHPGRGSMPWLFIDEIVLL